MRTQHYLRTVPRPDVIPAAQEGGETNPSQTTAHELLHLLLYAQRFIETTMFALESYGTKASIKDGIDFYDEVTRFETDLIRQALRETGGSQIRAAKLLGLNGTTLNSKIKLYNIDWKSIGTPSSPEGAP